MNNQNREQINILNNHQETDINNLNQELQNFYICHNKIKTILKQANEEEDILKFNNIKNFFNAKIVNTQFIDVLFYQQVLINSGIVFPKEAIESILLQYQDSNDSIETVFKTLQCHFLYLFSIKTQFRCFTEYYKNSVQDQNISFQAADNDNIIQNTTQQQTIDISTTMLESQTESEQNIFNISQLNFNNSKITIKLRIAKSIESKFQVVFDGHMIRHKIKFSKIDNIPNPTIYALYLDKVADNILKDKNLPYFYQEITQKIFEPITKDSFVILLNHISMIFTQFPVQIFINWVFDLMNCLMNNKNIMMIRLILQVLYQLDTGECQNMITKTLTSFQTYKISTQLPENTILNEIYLPECNIHNELLLKSESRYFLQRVYKYINIADDEEYPTNDSYNQLNNSPILYLDDYDEETLNMYITRQLQQDGVVFYDYDMLVIFYKQLIEQLTKKQISKQYFLEKHSVVCQLIINYQRIQFRDENDYEWMIQRMQQSL